MVQNSEYYFFAIRYIKLYSKIISSMRPRIGAPQWRRGSVLASQLADCGVESRCCPGCRWDVPSVYPLLSYQWPWCVVPCLWDIAHKGPLAIFKKE